MVRNDALDGVGAAVAIFRVELLAELPVLAWRVSLDPNMPLDQSVAESLPPGAMQRFCHEVVSPELTLWEVLVWTSCASHSYP